MNKDEAVKAWAEYAVKHVESYGDIGQFDPTDSEHQELDDLARKFANQFWPNGPEHSDRARHVTEQVTLWLMNDGGYFRRAVDWTYRTRRNTAEFNAVALAEWVTEALTEARKHTAPWQVGQELAANDYGRVRWADIVRELREAYDRDNDTTTEWNEG